MFQVGTRENVVITQLLSHPQRKVFAVTKSVLLLNLQSFSLTKPEEEKCYLRPKTPPAELGASVFSCLLTLTL